MGEVALVDVLVEQLVLESLKSPHFEFPGAHLLLLVGRQVFVSVLLHAFHQLLKPLEVVGINCNFFVEMTLEGNLRQLAV